MKKLLMIIDVQNDFCPGGALPVPKGDEVVPVINEIMDKFDYVIATRDWHPTETVHFNKWPVHCVRMTEGADFHRDLIREKINKIISKGTGNKDDGYSAFETEEVNLAEFIRSLGADKIYVCGLATEYCVRASAIDSVKNGFETYVISDAIRGIEVNKGDIEKAVLEMKEKGVKFLTSDEI